MVHASAHDLRRSLGEVDRLLGRAAPFDALSDVGRRRLLDESRLVCFDQKDLIYEAGTPATELILLLEGAIQIESPVIGARRGRVVAMVEAPYILGEAQVLHDRAFSGTGTALRPVTAAMVKKKTLEHLIASEPAFAVAYTKEIAFRFLQAIEARQNATTEPSIVLARYLVSYCALGSHPTRVALGQIEIAEATGLCRETVNRTLKAWAKAGHLRVTRGSLEDIDTAALRRLIDGSIPTLVQVTAGASERAGAEAPPAAARSSEARAEPSSCSRRG